MMTRRVMLKNLAAAMGAVVMAAANNEKTEIVRSAQNTGTTSSGNKALARAA